MTKFNLSATVCKRAKRVYDDLLARAKGDKAVVRTHAMAARSWCSRFVGSRRKGGALWLMWSMIADTARGDAQ